ncbi:DUF3325 domain-containing protein [Pseudomonas entomophila]|uniref:DUF3325 domain-containing protein n=2 Tax=Pseudomonas entomophila TaxID=312306 RepID=Q1I537_PSEE4|nr:DUF3325 domain-containing protein [Pseudomonas entomophila]WMW07034.1 DUF3325 domain-containing protein [Pseudomonas entomophila]CAK17248.1 conserved hypothetical protein; putative membrane protein [Pseudomonas entomophila L48]
MLSVALIGFAGFAGLCLAMEKHFNELLGRKPTAVQLRGLRFGGWALLLLSLVLAVYGRGWALGLVEWIAVLMAGVTVWVFGLPYQPRLLLGLAAASLLLGPLLALLAV